MVGAAEDASYHGDDDEFVEEVVGGFITLRPPACWTWRERGGGTREGETGSGPGSCRCDEIHDEQTEQATTKSMSIQYYAHTRMYIRTRKGGRNGWTGVECGFSWSSTPPPPSPPKTIVVGAVLNRLLACFMMLSRGLPNA